ncbi:MAG: DNA methyltransferase [Anaerolineae bacterium]|nr:DNA methyltransferase [Anaerolineae bacterium]MDQ7036379.1 DNA methyltransferase [Anaerolineae bacterium]
MMKNNLPLNQIINGDSIDILKTFPRESVDVVFADPPYNLQLQKELWRPNQTKVDAVNDAWDKFDDFQAYDSFTVAWLEAVRAVMKPKSSIWVSGTYHNIFRVGKIMQDIGFWLLNTVVWYKRNAMPNFNGTRLKNDVEFVIWAKKSEKSSYHFNYQLMKRFNDEKQLGSVWEIPVTSRSERLSDAGGNKLHSTQKPEALLRRILLAAGKPNDTVLDPFSGTGTTAAMAKYLHMNWIGIERDEQYIEPSRQRIESVVPISSNDRLFQAFAQTKPPKVEFRKLIKHGYLEIGQTLYLDKTDYEAQILENGSLKYNGHQGSIHQLGKQLKGTQSCNGWTHWRYKDVESGEKMLIDTLRHNYRLKEYDYDSLT